MTASAERGLRAERVAEVVVALPGERAGRRGSGYLVAPGRVLTAAHVVEGAVGVRVRFDADRPGERTVEAAVEWRHAGVEAAVLTLPRGTEADAVQPVSYGRVGDADAEQALPMGGEIVSAVERVAAQTLEMALLEDFRRADVA